MRLHVAVAGLAIAATHTARAEGTPAVTTPTGGAHYVALGFEQVTLSAPPTMSSAEHVATAEAGLRISDSPLPFYVHATAGAAPSGYTDVRTGVDLRIGGMVKGLFGIDAGYQHDHRTIDEMYSVTGPYVAPRLGLEVGTRAWWLRGSIDWRYTLSQTVAGHAASVALTGGLDF
jgi:hypothetical protein